MSFYGIRGQIHFTIPFHKYEVTPLSPFPFFIQKKTVIAHLPMASLLKRKHTLKVPLRGIEGALSRYKNFCYLLLTTSFKNVVKILAIKYKCYYIKYSTINKSQFKLKE